MKRHYRLRRNDDFQRVRQLGKFYASPLMVLAFVQNGLVHSRFGFVVSKRLGKAVKRNKIKRQMREVARLNSLNVKGNFDIVFIARKPLAETSYNQIERTIIQLLKRADLLQ